MKKRKRLDGFGICKGARPFEEEREEHPELIEELNDKP